MEDRVEEEVQNSLSNHSLNHPLLLQIYASWIRSLTYLEWILCAPHLKHYAILVDHVNFFYSHNDARALESVQYFNFSIGNSI